MQNYIFSQNIRFSTDSHAHRHNLNVVVIGGSGSGKTRFYVKPNAMQASGSYLFLDPKGELVRSLGGFYGSLGIPVTVIDLCISKGTTTPCITSIPMKMPLNWRMPSSTTPSPRMPRPAVATNSGRCLGAADFRTDPVSHLRSAGI